MNIMPACNLARLAASLLCALALAPLCGCPTAKPQAGKGTQTTAPALTMSTAPRVTLVCSDLGLEDGYMVRDAHAALIELDKAGRISLTLAGQLPAALEAEARAGDIGLPQATDSDATQASNLGETSPGVMSLQQAEGLLSQAGSPGLLVLSTEKLLLKLGELNTAGTLRPDAVLVLDGGAELAGGKLDPAPLHVWYLDYDILPAAFAGGVAAATSSNNAKFIALGSSADPKAEDWLDGLYAGAKWQSNGTGMITAVVQAGEDGEVSPDEYHQALAAARAEGGPDFAVNHYLAVLGRSTPSVLYALSSAPTNGYVVGGYGDFCQVRPGRFIGCALKKPGNAIRWLFDTGNPDAGAASLMSAIAVACGDAEATPAAESITKIAVGLPEHAVGFTDLNLYSRVNPDGDDIAEAVQKAWAQIEAGEIDVPQVVQQYNRQGR